MSGVMFGDMDLGKDFYLIDVRGRINCEEIRLSYQEQRYLLLYWPLFYYL